MSLNYEKVLSANKVGNSYTPEQVLSSSTEYFQGDTLAASTVIGKYLLKRVTDGGISYDEKNPEAMHRRLAQEIALIDCGFLFGREVRQIEALEEGSEWDTYVDRYLTYFNSFDHFKKIVPQGSPMYGIGNPYVRVSISNCVVVPSPADNISSIIGRSSQELANLFKRRCGVGIDISTLRPEGASVNNSAVTSTGAWSFAEHFSNVCRMIGQNGRRGALMITMDVRHPDIDRFVTMKRDLSRVTGANISIRLTDDFMLAVENNEDWICRWPVEDYEDEYFTQKGIKAEDILALGGKWVNVDANPAAGIFIGYERWISDISDYTSAYLKKFKAKDLWYLINESAVLSAEPGLLFWDNYLNNLPAHCYPGFKTICVNPCSEIGLSAFDSCRLVSLNLKGFVKNIFTDEAYFDMALFEENVRTGMRTMDNIVDLEIRYLTDIINKVDEPEETELWGKLRNAAIQGRRTGLGTHGLADALACLNLKYDSDEALEIVDQIFSTLRNVAYDESVNLAIERGAFPIFNWETEKDCEFIQRLPEWLQERIRLYGRRNISILTMAPTGSVSIVSQTSSGIEPVFSNFYMRRKKINPSDIDARVDFVDQNGDKWAEFTVFHHNITDYMQYNPSVAEKIDNIMATVDPSKRADEIAKVLPDFFVTAPEIDPMQRVKIQGVIQQYIDHGISSTLNLPKGTTIETCQKIYEASWRTGLKGVTVYVDGSRSGVLVNMAEKEDPNKIKESHSPKRPQELECEIHRANINQQKWIIMVGLLNGVPYEVFGGLSENVVVPKKFTTGKIRKRSTEKATSKGRNSAYDLYLGDEDDPFVINDIVSSFSDGDYAAQTRMISMALRHGISPQFVAEQLSRDKDASFFSFSKVMARVLKKYVADGVVSGESCTFCGAKLVFEDGCSLCKSCGQTNKCG